MNLFLKWVAQTPNPSQEPDIGNVQVEVCHFDESDRESSRVFIPLSEYTKKRTTYPQN